MLQARYCAYVWVGCVSVCVCGFCWEYKIPAQTQVCILAYTDISMNMCLHTACFQMCMCVCVCVRKECDSTFYLWCKQGDF